MLVTRLRAQRYIPTAEIQWVLAGENRRKIAAILTRPGLYSVKGQSQTARRLLVLAIFALAVTGDSASATEVKTHVTTLRAL